MSTPPGMPSETPEPAEPSAPAGSFTADTAGGLVDPILTGIAQPEARITVTADRADGREWAAVADESGEWSLLVRGTPLGTTVFRATQVDSAGVVSDAGSYTVELSAPTATFRFSDDPYSIHYFEWLSGTVHGEPDTVVQFLDHADPLIQGWEMWEDFPGWWNDMILPLDGTGTLSLDRANAPHWLDYFHWQ